MITSPGSRFSRVTLPPRDVYRIDEEKSSRYMSIPGAYHSMIVPGKVMSAVVTLRLVTRRSLFLSTRCTEVLGTIVKTLTSINFLYIYIFGGILSTLAEKQSSD